MAAEFAAGRHKSPIESEREAVLVWLAGELADQGLPTTISALDSWLALLTCFQPTGWIPTAFAPSLGLHIVGLQDACHSLQTHGYLATAADDSLCLSQSGRQLQALTAGKYPALPATLDLLLAHLPTMNEKRRWRYAKLATCAWRLWQDDSAADFAAAARQQPTSQAPAEVWQAMARSLARLEAQLLAGRLEA